MEMLNLGCGGVFHKDWTNIDMASRSPYVRSHDLRRPLPFPDAKFDVVYHSHVLEHFLPSDAELFVKECMRVLKPRGVLRVVVPDLEGIARSYIASLEQAALGETGAQKNHEWMTIELLDQIARSESGGRMRQYFYGEVPNLSFVQQRVGEEADSLISGRNAPARGFFTRVFAAGGARWVKRGHQMLVLGTSFLVGGRTALQNARNGAFRQSGEIHQWMYDRLSLCKLLESAGAKDVEVMTSATSHVENFGLYELDVRGGKTRKPDSLFMEGIKAP